MIGQVHQVGAHPRVGGKGAPIEAGEPGVVLWLELDLSFDDVGHGVLAQLEDHDSSLPPLARRVYARLVQAPAALVEYSPCGCDGT